jgi:hypothetical protein
MEDHKVVFDSLLTRSQQTYDEIIKRHRRKSIMQRDHAKGLVGIRQEHDGDLQLSKNRDNLVTEVDRLKELQTAANQ